MHAIFASSLGRDVFFHPCIVNFYKANNDNYVEDNSFRVDYCHISNMSISFLPLKCFFRVDFSRFKAIQQNMSTNASQNMPENSDNLRYLKSQNCDITQKVEAPIRFRTKLLGKKKRSLRLQDFVMYVSVYNKQLTLAISNSSASRKHAYIILRPETSHLYSKTGVYRGIHYFSYFCSKHRLWVLIRTASSRRF